MKDRFYRSDSRNGDYPAVYLFSFLSPFFGSRLKCRVLQISLLQLFLMRIRNVPPGVIVPSLIKAHKAGLGTITRDNLEAHYMTGGHVQRVVRCLGIGFEGGRRPFV